MHVIVESASVFPCLRGGIFLERKLKNVQLVVFDLGRVLVRICAGWQHACRCAGVALPGRVASPADQLKLRDLTFQADLGELDVCGFCRAAAPLIGLNESQVRALSDAFIRGPFPGAAELIDELNALGVATACLSNTNDNHWKLMSDRASPVHF